MTYDVAIVGGGIVGLATAYRLLEAYPEKRTIVLEKEPTIAAHQTGPQLGRDPLGRLLQTRFAQS